MRIVAQALALAAAFIQRASCTSVKMDFLPLAEVRTDPLLNPTCLSDHVHTFYGAAASLRPETTYAEMRSATENSGSVVENKSLYWSVTPPLPIPVPSSAPRVRRVAGPRPRHPTIYRVNNGMYEKVPIYFFTAYYVW